jgi:hypothetical protein
MSIKEFKLELEALTKKIKQSGYKAMKEDFKIFFDQNPEITAIAWTQYAPAFNDGDACTFSVHEFNFTTAPKERLKDAFGEFSGYGEENPADGFREGYGHKAINLLSKDVLSAHIFKTLFGDDCKVMVTKDLEIISDYVDHD